MKIRRDAFVVFLNDAELRVELVRLGLLPITASISKRKQVIYAKRFLRFKT